MEGPDDLEEYLRTARILDVSAPPGSGAHPSYRVTLEGGVSTLAKPAHKAPEEGAAMVRYEVAGWAVARDMGWGDLVATTVLRSTDQFPEVEEDVETSLQVLWPQFTFMGDMAALSDDDVWRAAVLDVLSLHSDRGGNNWGTVPHFGAPRLKLIDHGYAFRAWPNRPFASAFADARKDQEIPEEHTESLSAFLDTEHPQLQHDLLEPEVFEELLERGRSLVETGVLELP